MAYVIAEPCVGTKDTACVDACPVDCIHPKKDEAEFEAATMLYIHPVECIDCGACQPACPVTAIFPDADVPADMAPYTEINSLWYEDPDAARQRGAATVGGGGPSTPAPAAAVPAAEAGAPV